MCKGRLAPLLLQDETPSREVKRLCLWFATRPGARHFVRKVFMKQLDPLASFYKDVRDLVFALNDLTNSERVAVLELVKHELVTDMIDDIGQNLVGRY